MPQVSGQAEITVTASCSLAPSNPFPEGFTLGDIRWPRCDSGRAPTGSGGTPKDGPAAAGDGIRGAPAVGPKISGQARITGTASRSLDATDPFPEGSTHGDLR